MAASSAVPAQSHAQITPDRLHSQEGKGPPSVLPGFPSTPWTCRPGQTQPEGRSKDQFFECNLK